MAQSALTREQMQEALDTYTATGSITVAARQMNLPRGTFDHRLKAAMGSGLTARGVVKADIDNKLLTAQVRRLESEIRNLQKEALTAESVRREIFRLADENTAPPPWLSARQTKPSSPGVPTLFASDWHWGEIVDPEQIGGVNEYTVKIAHGRAKMLIEQASNLLRIISPKMDYPGIVFALGGDMVTGDIHEELTATNEMEIMPTVVDVAGVLSQCIATLADTFGHVFVPAVTGNHGRNTFKIRAKGRNFTSFDWLLYQWLASRFQSDKRVKFLIPDGSDALYRIYGHRYLLSHGDQYRGGDGLIGCLGPIMRGDHKKRSRNAQIDMGYDTQIIGHWHQLIQLKRIIVNGSLIGYNEYAWQGNMPFEEPAQALWLTHPQHGVTFSMPVYVDRAPKRAATPWVSVAA